MKGMDSVVEALQLWQLEGACPDHLDDEAIYRLAGDGGLSAASAGELSHLSECPLCMEEWAAWREAVVATDEVVSDGADAQESVSYGFLQAAASGNREPFVLNSSCGRFSIEIMPLVDNPVRVLVVFKVCGANVASFDRQVATLRDRAGNIFLSGCVQNGTFARNVDDIDSFDLTTWTLIFTCGGC